jgi:D-glycero-D-manno-heptose 1,7-bisphosphate phosphatase
MAIKTIFLDRDGVINKEVNYLYEIKNFKFIDGVFEACQYFQKLNYEIIIVSNQSGIARGYFKESDYIKLNKWMINQFEQKKISILDTFYCPHGPDSKCKCRKPQPGMFLEAEQAHNISMQDSWMIGDKESDILAAKNAGIFNTILVRSGHSIDVSNSSSTYIINSIKDSKGFIKY